MNARTLSLSLLTVAAALPAQGTGDAPSTIAADASDWLIPIHSANADEPGRWACGPTYKVRFDDGMTFFPVLGADAPHNLPLSWRTRSIRFDGHLELAEHGSSQATDWRYEVHYDSVVEAYDVRADGVEQTFVVAHAPADAQGRDLVIRGEIASELTAPLAEPAHQALEFSSEAGVPVVRYGAATVIDALGRRAPIDTSFDGEQIELRVPGAWLRDAAWPVTVDPLTQTLEFEGWFTSSAGDLEIERAGDYLCLAFTRAVSAFDRDLLLKRTSAQFLSRVTLYIDATTARTIEPSIGFAAGTQRVLLAMTVDSGAGTHVRVYGHDLLDNTPGSGDTLDIPTFGLHDADPDIAGGTGSDAFLAFRRDAGPVNSSSSIVVGGRLSASTLSFLSLLSVFESGTAASYDAEAPDVVATNGTGWLVLWQERNTGNPNDDWDAIGRRVSPTAAISTGFGVFGPGSSSRHKMVPHGVYDGVDFGVTTLARPNTGGVSFGSGGNEIWFERFRWLSNWHQPNASFGLEVAHSTLFNELAFGTGDPIAVDPLTESHFAIAWHNTALRNIEVVRLGYDDEVAELATVAASLPPGQAWTAAAVCDSPAGYAFAIVHGEESSGSVQYVHGRTLNHEPSSQQTIANGCLGTALLRNNGIVAPPFRGSGNTRIHLEGGAPSVPTWLLLGFGSGGGAVPLPVPPGCIFGLDLSLPIVQLASDTSSPAGSENFALAIPSVTDPLHLRLQWVQLDGAGHLTTSDTLALDIQ